MGRNKFGHYQHADGMVLSSIMSHVFYYKHPGFLGGNISPSWLVILMWLLINEDDLL